MIVDIHTHTFCPAVEPLVRELPGYKSIPYKRDMSPESAAVDGGQRPRLQAAFNGLEQRRADMRRMRVDAQVVAPAPGQQHYWATELVARVSSMQNDHVAALVAQAPDILAGIGTLPMPDVPQALAEARRAVQSLGLRGFQIDSRVNERELSDPSFDPLYEELASLGALLVIHPLGFSDGARLGPFFMVNVVGQPLEETIAFHHLVLGGVMDRHPGPAGADLPWWRVCAVVCRAARPCLGGAAGAAAADIAAAFRVSQAVFLRHLRVPAGFGREPGSACGRGPGDAGVRLPVRHG